MYRRHKRIVCWFLLAFTFAFASACSKQANKQTPPPPPDQPAPDLDPIQARLKERMDKVTKALVRQKELKATIPQMPIIEKFTRETSEREIIDKLGEPETTRDVNMEKTQQRVFYYNKSKFAVWLWREKEVAGPYQYRATVSLNQGRFDTPLHNVLTDEELKRMQAAIENDK